VGGTMRSLRTFMFDRVYLGKPPRAEHAKIARVIRTLFHHYCEHPAELPPATAGDPLSVRVTDYLAGMTDRFCLRAFEALAVPKGFL